MNLYNINKINNIDFKDLLDTIEIDEELDKNSTNGLQNKVVYDLIKRLYTLLKHNGYDDEYFDDLIFNNIYMINYLTNNKITLNNIEINENELLNSIDDAKRLIINNERTEDINISYITNLTNLDYCECISNNLILSDNITIPLNLKTLIIPEPTNSISINCNSNLKFCSFVNNKTDLTNAFNNITFTNEPIKYYGLSNDTEDTVELYNLTYENMYVNLKKFIFYKTSSSSANTNIKNIILSDSNKINKLESDCFRDCSNLSSINIPTSVTVLGYFSLHNCSNLSSIVIPSSVSIIRDDSFKSCTNLTSININSTSIKYLSSECFQNCYSLSSIIIPTSVSYLGNSCFENCSNLLSIDIPSLVTILRTYCFKNCSNLLSITLPTSLSNLDYQCFYNCSKLSSITIPTSVSNLDYQCFENCTNLSSVIISTSIYSIGSNCFRNTKSDIQFKILASTQSNANSLGLSIKNRGSAPEDATYYYGNNDNWTQFTPA